MSVEMNRLFRMPVARRENWQAGLAELLDITIENGNHFVAVVHCQSAARTKIVLHIDNDECILTRHRFLL